MPVNVEIMTGGRQEASKGSCLVGGSDRGSVVDPNKLQAGAVGKHCFQVNPELRVGSLVLRPSARGWWGKKSRCSCRRGKFHPEGKGCSMLPQTEAGVLAVPTWP